MLPPSHRMMAPNRASEGPPSNSGDPPCSSASDFPPEPLVRRLILSYLVRNCYTGTALAYTPEDHPECLEASDLEEISTRKEMIDRISEGDICGAVSLAESLLECPLAEVDEELWFDCCLQEFTECIRSKSVSETLKVLQEKVAGIARGHETRLKKLVDYIQLFLNKVPENGPAGMLMKTENRKMLGERLNGIVVGKIRGGGEKGELEMLIRQTVLVKELEAAGGLLEKKSKLTVDDLFKENDKTDQKDNE